MLLKMMKQEISFNHVLTIKNDILNFFRVLAL